MTRLPASFFRRGQLFILALLAPLTEASVTLNWRDNSSNEHGFSIERSSDGNRFQEIARVASNVVEFTDEDATEGNTFHYRVRAFNAFGHSGYTNTIKAIIENARDTIAQTPSTSTNETTALQLLSPQNLPSKVIGGSPISSPHTYYESMGVHLLSASGNGLGERQDNFSYTYLPTDETSQIVARVTEHSSESPTSKCGIMLRSSLDPDSPFAAVLLSGTGSTHARWRSTKAAISQTHQLFGTSPQARYLKIRHRGSQVWFSSSPNGYDWSPDAQASIDLGPTPLLGLFLASSQESNAIAVIEVLESTEPLLPPSGSYYRNLGKESAIGLSSSQVSSEQDATTGLYKLTAMGRGFEYYRDQINFNYWTGAKTCRIVTKIHAFEEDGSWARTGLALRSSLEPDSAVAAVTLNGYGRIETLTRTRNGERVSTRSGPSLPSGCYLALERQGNEVVYQWSPDGVTWHTFHSATLELPDVHHVGLVLGSQNGSSSSLLELIGLY